MFPALAISPVAFCCFGTSSAFSLSSPFKAWIDLAVGDASRSPFGRLFNPASPWPPGPTEPSLLMAVASDLKIGLAPSLKIGLAHCREKRVFMFLCKDHNLHLCRFFLLSTSLVRTTPKAPHNRPHLFLCRTSIAMAADLEMDQQ
ncbi:Protein kinase domain-containing protein [Psidium guajava]|nr:Protein kinase domain-containing protein [Psidium guajava]